MTTQDDEDLYWQLVDEFIGLANDKMENNDQGVVLSAVIGAATRFSAFYAASNSESKKDLREDKDQVVGQLGAEFKRKLADDIDDYIDNYKVYMREDDAE